MKFLKAPKGLREGQTLINFLFFLETEKDYYARVDVSDRGRDVFYIEDEILDSYWKEFINKSN